MVTIFGLIIVFISFFLFVWLYEDWETRKFAKKFREHGKFLKLNNTDLKNAHLSGVDLSQANLHGAYLKDAYLVHSMKDIGKKDAH